MRGMRGVVPVPISAWGLVNAPCVLGAAPVVTADSRCGGVNNGGAAAGAAGGPVALGLGAFLVAGVLLFAVFGGGDR